MFGVRVGLSFTRSHGGCVDLVCRSQCVFGHRSVIMDAVCLQPVMKWTDSQVADMMTIRRLFYCKLGQLARLRRDVLTKMTWTQVDSSHVTDKLSNLSTWAEHLQENGHEEYRTYSHWAVAMFRGVSQPETSTSTMMAGHKLGMRNLHADLISCALPRAQTRVVCWLVIITIHCTCCCCCCCCCFWCHVVLGGKHSKCSP